MVPGSVAEVGLLAWKDAATGAPQRAGTKVPKERRATGRFCCSSCCFWWLANGVRAGRPLVLEPRWWQKQKEEERQPLLLLLLLLVICQWWTR